MSAFAPPKIKFPHHLFRKPTPEHKHDSKHAPYRAPMKPPGPHGRAMHKQQTPKPKATGQRAGSCGYVNTHGQYCLRRPHEGKHGPYSYREQ